MLVWWLTSASTLLVVLLFVAGYYVVSTVQSFVHTHRTGCLPADFPIYSSVTVLEVDETIALPGNGGSAECRMGLTSKDPYDSVNSFYRAQLNSGDWFYISYTEDVGGSITSFQRRSHPATRGSVTIHKQGGGTPFEVQLLG